MKDSYRIVYEGGQGEIIEKKSRFIGIVFPVETEEEAISYLGQLKKKYWDARHCCYAYVIGADRELQRFSDDGEPQGTAGKPILDVLAGAEVCNTMIAVIRYFGGTLLGTGGLVRAYGQSAKAGLDHSIILEKQRGILLEIQTEYNSVGKIQHLLGQRQLEICNSDYGESVLLQTAVPIKETDAVMTEIKNATSACARLEQKRELYFAKYNKDILMFDS